MKQEMWEVLGVLSQSGSADGDRSVTRIGAGFMDIGPVQTALRFY